MSDNGKKPTGIAHVASMWPLAKARVPDLDHWGREVAREVRELCAQLGGAGWDFVDIAEAIQAGRNSLYEWRLGARDMPAKKLLALRALAAEHARRTGS
jgi:hypothetical protein